MEFETWSSWSVGRLIYEVIKDRKMFANWLLNQGLIPEKRYCDEGHQMKLVWKYSFIPAYRCFRKQHLGGIRKTRGESLMKGTIFEQSNLKAEKILMICLLFANHYSFTEALREMKFFGKEPSTTTMSYWYSFCRDLISRWMLENEATDGKLGGSDKTVHIEVYEFERPKVLGGDHSMKAEWIMGVVELETNRYLVETFHGVKPNQETLYKLIVMHVFPQTIVVSDSKDVVNSLENCENYYISKTEKEKIVPESRTLLQAVESSWRCQKRKRIPNGKNSSKAEALGERYLEYLFRRKMAHEKIDVFDQLIELFKQYYSPKV